MKCALSTVKLLFHAQYCNVQNINTLYFKSYRNSQSSLEFCKKQSDLVSVTKKKQQMNIL